MNKTYKKTKFNITTKTIYIFIAIFFILYSTLFNYNNANAAPADGIAGWAWSENIGWISFNDLNCDVDGDGTYEGGGEGGGATPAPVGCPIAGAVVPYGVDIDTNPGPTFGYLSGYAWSENIGWISFEPADVAGCPWGACQPLLVGNDFRGWARALNHGGGWDGWISLSCKNKPGSCVTSNYEVSLNGSDFEGWAWGDIVVGWISFNSKNCDTVAPIGQSDGGPGCPALGTPMVSYKVHLTNNAPTVVPNPIIATDYCASDLPGGISLSWTFNDTEDGAAQTGYKINLLKDGMVPCAILKNPDPATSILGSDINASCGAGFIDYGNHTYTWNIEVYDSDGGDSGLVTGEDFPNPNLAGIPEPTPTHRWPTVNFSFSTVDGPPILQLQDITFDPSTSVVYGAGTTIASFEWDFEDDGIIDETTLPASPNTIHFYSEENTFDIVLKVTDSDGYNCSTSQPLTTGKNIPDWNETIP